MALLGLEEAIVVKASNNRIPRLPNCVGSLCRDPKYVETHFNTLSLRTAEIIMVGITVVTNLLLIIAIVSARKLSGSTFFKMVIILSTLFLLHSLSVLLLKILPILLSYSFPYQLQASLYSDIFTSYYSVLLIFLLSLDRCFMFMAKAMGDVLFSSWQFWIHPLVTFAVSVSATVAVILVDEITRKYVSWLGYADYAKSETASTIINYAFIAVTLLSLGLHIVIYLWMRKTRTKFSSINRGEAYKAEQRMLIQIILMAIMQLLLSALFVVIPLLHISENALFFIVSLYNILCSIPELLIPIFILLISKDLKQSLGRLILRGNSSTQLATKSHSKTAVATF